MTRIPRFAAASALTAFLVLVTPAAQAYIGPGAGLTAIGTVIALVAGVLLGILGFVWYPVKRLVRMLRAPQPAAEKDPADRPTTDAEPANITAAAPKQRS